MKQTTVDVTSIKAIKGNIDFDKNKNFEKLQNYRKDTTNVATGTN